MQPLTFLPASKLRGPPLYTVFADRLSIMPADGLAARPPNMRTATAGRWSIDTHRPLSRHAARYRYTVCRGGTPFGNMRHGRPQHRTDKIGLTTPRESIRRFRPGGLRGGASGALRLHSVSPGSLVWRRPSRAYCDRAVSARLSGLAGFACATGESQPTKITQLISKRTPRSR